MQQIYNITQVRNNFSSLVSEVARKKKTMVIIRDSIPEVVLISYEEYIKTEEEKEKLWQVRFEKLLKEGKKAFRKWSKEKKINLKKLTEEKVYDIMDKV